MVLHETIFNATNVAEIIDSCHMAFVMIFNLMNVAEKIDSCNMPFVGDF